MLSEGTRPMEMGVDCNGDDDRAGLKRGSTVRGLLEPLGVGGCNRAMKEPVLGERAVGDTAASVRSDSVDVVPSAACGGIDDELVLDDGRRRGTDWTDTALDSTSNEVCRASDHAWRDPLLCLDVGVLDSNGEP